MGASACCYFSYLRYHLCYLLHSLFFVITPIALYTTSYSQLLSIHPLQLATHFSSITIIISPRHTSHCQPRRLTATISRSVPYPPTTNREGPSTALGWPIADPSSNLIILPPAPASSPLPALPPSFLPPSNHYIHLHLRLYNPHPSHP